MYSLCIIILISLFGSVGTRGGVIVSTPFGGAFASTPFASLIPFFCNSSCDPLLVSTYSPASPAPDLLSHCFAALFLPASLRRVMYTHNRANTSTIAPATERPMTVPFERPVDEFLFDEGEEDESIGPTSGGAATVMRVVGAVSAEVGRVVEEEREVDEVEVEVVVEEVVVLVVVDEVERVEEDEDDEEEELVAVNRSDSRLSAAALLQFCVKEYS